MFWLGDPIPTSVVLFGLEGIAPEELSVIKSGSLMARNIFGVICHLLSAALECAASMTFARLIGKGASTGKRCLNVCTFIA